MKRFPARFEIAGRALGAGASCLIIAEAGVSHFGDPQKADRLVDLAAEAGADVFKTQFYRTDLLVGPQSPEWRERLRPKEVSGEAIAAMKRRCEERGILFLCTPHEEEALDFLDRELDVPAFKIGSGEVENWPFLARAARRGKPMILSTGMYRLEQIHEAIRVVAENGAPPLAILHCVTRYPAAPELINLQVMGRIRDFFPGPVGYSDHTEGTAIPLAAAALGADVLEKHITLDRDVPNAQDWKVSCDPSNFAAFVRDVRSVESALGGGDKVISREEQESMLWARKSLTARVDIPAGMIISEELLVAQRPGTGLPPSRLEAIVGRRTTQSIPAGCPIALSMFDSALSPDSASM